MSYTPKVYRRQGADAFVVTDGGFMQEPVTAGTTAADFAPFGHTYFGHLTTKEYTQAAPYVAGVRKSLTCTIGGTSGVQTVAMGRSIGGSTAAHTKLNFNAPGSATLIARTTAQWDIVAVHPSTAAVYPST